MRLACMPVRLLTGLLLAGAMAWASSCSGTPAPAAPAPLARKARRDDAHPAWACDEYLLRWNVSQVFWVRLASGGAYTSGRYDRGTRGAIMWRGEWSFALESGDPVVRVRECAAGGDGTWRSFRFRPDSHEDRVPAGYDWEGVATVAVPAPPTD